MTSIPEDGTAGIEPVMTSAALSGHFAQIFPNSETCSRWMVPDRIEVATRMLLLLCANTSSLALFFFSGIICRSPSGRLS